MNIADKTILLTGASGGIGRAIAQRTSALGARLVLVGRNEASLRELQQSLGIEAMPVVADLTCESGRATIASECKKAGGIDILINAAGTMDFGLFETQSSESVEQTISTNLLAPLLLCQALLPDLKSRSEAAIVNIGSTFGSIGHPGFSAYCASKFGLRGFTEALRRELADTRIKVFYLAPRATDTKLNNSAVRELNETLGNKTDTPGEVARELVALISGDCHQRFIGWPEKLYVRLNALWPGIVHNAMAKKLPVIKQVAEQQ